MLAGDIIDLGARNGDASYYRFFNIEKGRSFFTYTDLQGDGDKIVQVNLENPLPLDPDCKDRVILMHVLEHLYNPSQCINECYRIIRPGGKLIGAVPFLYRVHPDPYDFYRFTRSALERMLNEAGFSDISVEELGYGPFSAGLQQYARILKIKHLVFLATIITIALDKVLNQFFKGNPNAQRENYPLAYFFVATK